MPIEKEHADLLGIKEADEIEFDFDVVKDWPEPIIPEDVQKRIEEEDLADSWQDLTAKLDGNGSGGFVLQKTRRLGQKE